MMMYIYRRSEIHIDAQLITCSYAWKFPQIYSLPIQKVFPTSNSSISRESLLLSLHNAHTAISE